jgi:preprotein translocase subunit SecE
MLSPRAVFGRGSLSVNMDERQGMNVKLEHQETATRMGDMAKYVAGVLLFLAGFAVNFFTDWPGPIRGLSVALGLLSAIAVTAFTSKGRQVREFLVESRFELRKVVWPTRQETWRTTAVILLVVVVISLLLALVDWIISSAVQGLLG